MSNGNIQNVKYRVETIAFIRHCFQRQYGLDKNFVVVIVKNSKSYKEKEGTLRENLYLCSLIIDIIQRL